jgi:hypothetical protein
MERFRETLIEADLIHCEVVCVVLREWWLSCLLRLFLNNCLLCRLTELAKEVILIIIE